MGVGEERDRPIQMKALPSLGRAFLECENIPSYPEARADTLREPARNFPYRETLGKPLRAQDGLTTKTIWSTQAERPVWSEVHPV